MHELWTHLLRPFSDERVALSIIAVVDPAFTLAIAVPLMVGVYRRQPAAARLGLALGVCYLASGVFRNGNERNRQRSRGA